MRRVRTALMLAAMMAASAIGTAQAESVVRYGISMADIPLTTGQPVATEIRNRLPASAELTLLGLVIAIVIAIPLGIMAATRPGSWIDHLCRVTTTAGVSLPVFFTGLVLVYVFYFKLGWAPAPLGRLDVFYSAPPTVTGFYLIDSLIARDFETFRSALSQLVLPAATLAIFSFMWTWNDLLNPLIYLRDLEQYTTTVGLALFQGQFVGKWPEMMAGALVSLAPMIAATTLRALDLLDTDPSLLGTLRRNAQRFREGMVAAGFQLTGAGHPIVPVMIGDARRAGEMAERLLAEGLYVVAFSYPVVPNGAARIRTQMSAAHTDADVDEILNRLDTCMKEVA